MCNVLGDQGVVHIRCSGVLGSVPQNDSPLPFTDTLYSINLDTVDEASWFELHNIQPVPNKKQFTHTRLLNFKFVNKNN